MRTPASGGGRAERVRTFDAFLDGLVALRGWLIDQQVTDVAMEATSTYWLPVWRVLEEHEPFELVLANPRHVKHVPGRKTDVNDASWLCQLLECGLVAASFVPPPTIRELRTVTRYRKRQVQLRTSQAQRIEKLLEDAVIKIGVVASKTLTKSGRKMLEALIAGERDPAVLADMAYGRMRPKIPELIRALDGRFADHHAIQLRPMLDRIDTLDATIDDLNGRIEHMTAPFADVIDRLQTIPGVARRTAEIIVAETGADMTRFPDAAHLASWAGLCPGHNESGGKRKPGRTTPGNPALKEALIEAAWAAARTRDTYLAAKFRRVAGPRPNSAAKKKAAVAVAHKMLIAAYHIIDIPDETYRDLGGDYFTRRANPDRRKRRLIRQLTDLGYNVELTPTA